MTYATLDQLTDRFGEALLIQLTDRETPATGAIVTAVVDRALADTDAMIDGYLASRYALPVAEVPALLADIAQAIAIYKLHVYGPDPKIAEDYKTAMRQLEQIGKGTIQLSVAGLPAAASGGTGARITDRERPLTAENLKGFI